MGTGEARLAVSGREAVGVRAGSGVEAVGVVFGTLGDAGAVEAVGYRVVHPGARSWQDHVRITMRGCCGSLEAAASFAPLHDPEAVAVIREGMRAFSGGGAFCLLRYGVSSNDAGGGYGLSGGWGMMRARGVRRYGFHGLSCESVVWQMRRAVGGEVSAEYGDCAPGGAGAA